MKTTKVVYWTSTIIIFLLEGLMPAFTGHSKFAIEGITHLGYPVYFATMLTVYKVLGGIAIIIPVIPQRIKEWAYAGLAFELTSAFISHAVVDGFGGQTFFPILVLAILVLSYIFYNKVVPNSKK